jgi:hypothetical protein
MRLILTDGCRESECSRTVLQGLLAHTEWPDNLPIPYVANGDAKLIDALRAQHPGLRLLLTHSTATGRALGQGLLQAGDQQGEAIGRVVSRYLYGDLDAKGAIDGLVGAIHSKGDRR